MKVFICEQTSITHLDPIVSWIRLVNDTKLCNLYLYCQKSLRNEIVAALPKYGLQQCDNNLVILSSQIKFAWQTILTRNSLFIFPTLSSKNIFQWILLLIGRNNRICLGTHSLSQINVSIDRSPALGIKNLLSFRTIEYIFQYLILNNSNFFYSVGNSSQHSYLCSLGIDDNKVVTVPFSYPRDLIQLATKKAKQIEESQFDNIVIPGIYSQERRDYLGLLEYILENHVLSVDRKIRITFLGCPPVTRKARENGQSSLILNYLQRAASSYPDQIKWFNTFISSATFEKELLGALLIISPTVQQFRSTDIYGLSKDTGVFYNSLSSLTPLLMPSFINIPKEFQPLIIPYNSYSNLFDKICNDRQNINGQDIKCWRNEVAELLSKYFNNETIKAKNKNFWRSLE